MPEITGHTRVFGILADPVTHVKTPQVFNRLLADEGIDGVMVPLQVPPERLATLLDGLRQTGSFDGFIATIPHKMPVAALCDEVTEQGRRVGAVNCVRRTPDGRLIGTITDGLGFVRGLHEAGIDPAGMHVLQAGAGGAGRAIAFALADAGVAGLTILNRSQHTAEALAGEIGREFPALALATVAGAGGFDLIVNATPLGMHAGDPLPVDAAVLIPGTLVAEAIMEPATTPLLAAAEAAGCCTHPGLAMLTAQIRLMAEHMGALPRTAADG